MNKNHRYYGMTWNHAKAVKAQKDFCNKKGVPHFASKDGYCIYCGRDIYAKNGGIPVEVAAREVVSGCPWCRRSYCA